MSYLYPRLEKSEAILIAEGLRGTTLESFDDPYGPLDFGKATTKPTGGVPVSTEHLRKLRLDVVEALAGIDDGITGSAWADEYDRRLGKSLWENLEMIAGDSGSPEVWNYLSLVVLPNTCNTRYSLVDDENLHRHIGPVRRTYLKNLWIRRRIYGSRLDEGLSVFSDDLHFQITDRVIARTTPHLCHAIIDTLSQTPKVSRVFYRRLLREIQAVASYVPFGLLPDNELRNLVYEVGTYVADVLGVDPPVRRSQIVIANVERTGPHYENVDTGEQGSPDDTDAKPGIYRSETDGAADVQISKPSQVRLHFESFKATSDELRITSAEARESRHAGLTASDEEAQVSTDEADGGTPEKVSAPVENPGGGTPEEVPAPVGNAGDIILVNSFTLRTWRKICNKLNFRGLLDEQALGVFEDFLEERKCSDPIAATLMMRYMATALERGIMKTEEIMRKIK